MVRFVKKLAENDSFGVNENNRDQIIVSATEIHLMNIAMDKYQINIVPLKARNVFFNYFLKEHGLSDLFCPWDLEE